MKLVSMLLCGAALVNIHAQQAPKRAPGFCLSDTNGQWHDLYDYRGKVVVLEFMQTTCPHCAAFAPALASIAQKYAGRVQVLALALPPDTPATMLQFVNGHKPPYPLLMDMGQVAASYVRAPGVTFPRVYLIDAEGTIRANWEEGPLTKNIFEGSGLSQEIDRLLAAQKK
ncbi:MAG TPA: TlpA disulfide reductase family protein [Candidatus Acidoferrales bacterium]|nr:TlpA disulfide reductase family protein [Candidatus Acidoferrales bacterium]